MYADDSDLPVSPKAFLTNPSVALSEWLGCGMGIFSPAEEKDLTDLVVIASRAVYAIKPLDDVLAVGVALELKKLALSEHEPGREASPACRKK